MSFADVFILLEMNRRPMKICISNSFVEFHGRLRDYMVIQFLCAAWLLAGPRLVSRCETTGRRSRRALAPANCLTFDKLQNECNWIAKNVSAFYPAPRLMQARWTGCRRTFIQPLVRLNGHHLTLASQGAISGSRHLSTCMSARARSLKLAPRLFRNTSKGFRGSLRFVSDDPAFG